MTGLSFLATTPNAKEVVFFKEYALSSQYTPHDILVVVEQALDDEPLLKACDDIRLVYANTTYTLVPETLFDTTKLSEYLKFNAKILHGDFIAYEQVGVNDLNVVYVPLVNINNFFYETFGDFQYYHAATILLDHVLSQEQKNMENQAYIHVHKSHFDVVLLKKGALRLCNSYSYQTPEDLAYYILFALEQHKMNPETVATQVFGAITENDANFLILYTYIRNIEIAAIQSSLRIEGVDPHQQFLLKNVL